MDIGEIFPDFKATTTIGEIQFYDWLDKSWCLLFSVCCNFEDMCATELEGLIKLMPELKKRGVRPLVIACDELHLEWISKLKNLHGGRIQDLPFPIISDTDRRLSALLSILDWDQSDVYNLPLAGRAVFIIDPTKKLRLKLVYPGSTGRNLIEILRVIESIQITDKKKAEAALVSQAKKDSEMNPNSNEQMSQPPYSPPAEEHLMSFQSSDEMM